MKYLVSLFMFSVALFSVNAQSTFEVNDIKYKIISDSITYEVEVARKIDCYFGDFVIPSEVTYDSTNYSVTAIGNAAFTAEWADSGCVGLQSIEIPNSVLEIKTGAFAGCVGLTEIEIPNSVTQIGDFAFSNCTGISNVVFGNSLSSIGEGAFSSCSGITSITLPNSLDSLGKDAFFNCDNLLSVILPDNLTNISQGAFEDCESLTTVNIPNALTSIPNRMFYECSSISEITFPQGLESIGERSFYNCNLIEEMDLPSTLLNIGSNAFTNCNGLLEITSEAETPPSLGSDVFFNVNKSIPLYVPESSLTMYENASQWEDFLVQKIIITNADKVNENEVKLFPNPTNGQIFIESSATNEIDFQLFDVKGKVVLSKTISGAENLDISNLTNGVYFYQYIVNQQIVNGKLIKH